MKSVITIIKKRHTHTHIPSLSLKYTTTSYFIKKKSGLKWYVIVCHSLVWIAFNFQSEKEKAQQECQMERIYSAIALTAAVAPIIIHQMWHFIGSKRFILMANFLTIVAWILVMFYRYVFELIFCYVNLARFNYFDSLWIIESWKFRSIWLLILSSSVSLFLSFQWKLFIFFGCPWYRWSCHWNASFPHPLIHNWYCSCSSKAFVPFNYATAIRARHLVTVYFE